MTDAPVHFYYREGCHLCEEMAAHLFREWPTIGAQMLWHDVDTRDDWRVEYGLRVPVLVSGDQVLSEYFIDSERIAAHFGQPSNPL